MQWFATRWRPSTTSVHYSHNNRSACLWFLHDTELFQNNATEIYYNSIFTCNVRYTMSLNTYLYCLCCPDIMSTFSETWFIWANEFAQIYLLFENMSDFKHKFTSYLYIYIYKHIYIITVFFWSCFNHRSKLGSRADRFAKIYHCDYFPQHCNGN